MENTTQKNWTKEGHIEFLKGRVTARHEKMATMMESLRVMQEMNTRDLLRLEELRLLKDIKDGKITLVDAQSGQPFNVRVFKA